MRLAPLIPRYVNPDPYRQGWQRADDRVCLDAIFFVLRAGYQWKALDAAFIRPGSTGHIKTRGEDAKLIKRTAAYKARHWLFERTHNWMNRFRHIITRWERKPQTTSPCFTSPVHGSLTNAPAFSDRLFADLDSADLEEIVFPELEDADVRDQIRKHIEDWCPLRLRSSH